MLEQQWLKQRRKHNPITITRIGKYRSKQSLDIANSTLNLLLSPTRNPVHSFSLKIQKATFKITSSIRSIEQNLRARKIGARIFKQAKTGLISEKQRRARLAYGKLHKDNTIKEFWQYVYFTDKAHIDSSLVNNDGILHESGTQYKPENLVTTIVSWA